MDPEAILALLQPLVPALVEDIQTSFNDFDANTSLEYRLDIEVDPIV